MEYIEEAFEDSSKIIGIKPITDKMINDETKKIIKINENRTNKNEIQ